jgi:hypothetical protein
MKTRAGFVSNSSSSSFMIGIGLVVDQKKLDKYIKKYQGKHNARIHVFTADDVDDWYASIQGEHAVLDGFDGSRVRVNLHDKPDAKIVTLFVCDDEGDYAFWDESGEEMNYDIDLDFFSKEQQELYLAFGDNSGIQKAETQYGAGRNG